MSMQTGKIGATKAVFQTAFATSHNPCFKGTKVMSEIDFTAIAVRACVKCGATERYKRGDCKVCARAIAKAWHRSNTEKSNAKGLAWYAANKAQSAANNKA